jgi:hypothetical protein
MAAPLTNGQRMKRSGLGLGLAVTTLSGAAAWVGIRTGLRDSGVVSIAGWAVGLAGAILGLTTILGTAGLLMTPSSVIDQALKDAEAETLRRLQEQQRTVIAPMA